MLRSIPSVVVGFASWTVLWLGSNGGLAAAMPEAFNEAGAPNRSSVMVIILVLSVDFSIVAGYLTGWVAGRRPIAHTVVLGVIQLAVGIYVQAQYWNVMPLWYHLPFLALLLPGNVVGGAIRARQAS